MTDADLSGASLLGGRISARRQASRRAPACREARGSQDRSACGNRRVWRAALPVPGHITPSLGLASSVNSLAFNPAGDLLATAHADGTIAVWDVEAGQVLRIFEGFTEAVRSVAFSPDGRMLASGSMDGLVRLWKVEQGLLLHTLQGHSRQVRSVAFSPDGKALATGSEDKTIRLWSVEQGAPLHTLQGHTKSVLSVAFSRDGRMLATGSADATVQLWERGAGRDLRTLQGHTDYARSVAFSPDGQMLASGSTGGTVRLWSVERGALRALEGHKQLVLNVEFSLDGGTLIPLRGWDRPALGRGAGSRRAHPGRAYVLRPERGVQPGWQDAGFGPDRWGHPALEHGTGRPAAHPPGTDERWSRPRVAFSPDGKTLASGPHGHERPTLERGARSIPPHSSRTCGLCPECSVQPGWQAAGFGLHGWDCPALERGAGRASAHPRRAHGAGPQRGVQSRGQAAGFWAGDDGNVRLWGVEHGVLVRVLVGQGKAVLSVALSRDGGRWPQASRMGISNSGE